MSADSPSADTPPLKRHPALQPLSREHMSGLVQARNLHNAAGQDERTIRARVIAEFIEAWRSEIRPHFDDEERLLLPLLGSGELRERLLAEHRQLRELAAQAEGGGEPLADDPVAMRHLAVLLQDHIRWEERVLFETVQREHPEEIASLITHADQIESTRPGSRARKHLDRRF